MAFLGFVDFDAVDVQDAAGGHDVRGQHRRGRSGLSAVVPQIDDEQACADRNRAIGGVEAGELVISEEKL